QRRAVGGAGIFHLEAFERALGPNAEVAVGQRDEVPALRRRPVAGLVADRRAIPIGAGQLREALVEAGVAQGEAAVAVGHPFVEAVVADRVGVALLEAGRAVD